VSVDFVRALRARAEASGVQLDDDATLKLRTYFELLSHWNRRINLTALDLDGFPSATLDRLILEPLVAADVIDPNTDVSLLDLGSGGGSPAIPLAIARPRILLSMVESRQKKCSFLREALRVLSLSRSRIICARFEELDLSDFEALDYITLRAVRIDDTLELLLYRLSSPVTRILIFGSSDVQLKRFTLAETRSLQNSTNPLTIWQRLS
jgi:16S rRNA (guanine527-N7)-methyltransferase